MRSLAVLYCSSCTVRWYKETMLIALIVLTLVFASHSPFVTGIDGSDDVQTLLSFGMLRLSEYKHVGSQEVIYVPIPAAYLSNFTFEWTGTAEVGNSISQHCSDVTVIVLVRDWSFPIYDPFDAQIPEQTWPPYDETAFTSFNISHNKPETKFTMQFSDHNNVTVPYYVAVFLVDRGDDRFTVDGLSADCEYFVALTVKAYSDVPLDVAGVDTTNYLHAINETSIQSDYDLERMRTGLMSTVYVTDNKGYNVTRNSSLKFSWLVRPYEDVGGVLKVGMLHNSADAETFNGTLEVKGCVGWGSTPGQSYDDCVNGYPISLNVSLENDGVTSAEWYWPFPKGGLWTLDLGLDCGSYDCEDPTTVNVYVGIVPCINSCHSDEDQGECKLFRTDVLFFSACECKSGWQGVDCGDGTNAIPRERQLLIVLMLTLSNLIFLPCIVLAIMNRYYTEAFVYFFVLFFSSFYHACDGDFVVAKCIMKYNTLQYCDFLGAITALWVTVLAIADLPYVVESWFHVAGLMMISFAVEYNRFSLYTFLLPILCALVVLSASWGKRCKSTHRCYPDKHRWIFSIVPGIVCSGIGIILYAFVETTDNYFYVHSIWHVLMGSAIMFLLPKEKKNRHLSHSVVSAVSSNSSPAGSFLQYNVDAEVSSVQGLA